MSTASAIGAEDGRSAAKQAAATPGLIVPRPATPTLGRALLLHKSLKGGLYASSLTIVFIGKVRHRRGIARIVRTFPPFSEFVTHIMNSDKGLTFKERRMRCIHPKE